MSKLFDDKSTHCLNFILEQYHNHSTHNLGASNTTPVFVGINGAQGAGKSTLVCPMYMFPLKPQQCLLPASVYELEHLFKWEEFGLLLVHILRGPALLII